MAGVRLLAEHLAQTKLQHEEVTYKLKLQIVSCTDENERLRATLSAHDNEVQEWKAKCAQMEIENTKKWRIQERADWKSLVSALQADRRRLEDEVAELISLSEADKSRLRSLELQVQATATEDKEGAEKRSASEIDQLANSYQADRFRALEHQLAKSSQVERDLRSALKEAHQDIEALRIQAEGEIEARDDEIIRLRQQLNAASKNSGYFSVFRSFCAPVIDSASRPPPGPKFAV